MHQLSNPWRIEIYAYSVHIFENNIYIKNKINKKNIFLEE